MPNEEKVNRKLRAIISADVKGYSILMADNEIATIGTLKQYREIMSKLINQYGGRVVDSPGDNMLAEFGSVIDGLKCAVKIQQELRGRNAELPEKRKMQFRIGINVGDVIENEGRIYGTGINVAARIEGLAESGGICVSRSVYDQAKSGSNIVFQSIGKHKLKNINEEVEVYSVLFEDSPTGSSSISGQPIDSGKSETPSPVRKSIAVLPFVNMSSNPELEYLSDGLVDNIITSLSRTSALEVIAQNSTFTYKGKSVNIQQVGSELGVQYVMEGSIQKSGDRVRINAQLIDAQNGHHLWAERFDRILKDIFELQDEITLNIMRSMQAKVTAGEQIRLWEGSTKNLAAYETYYEAVNEYFRKGNISRSQQLCEEAIRLDPNYIEPIVRLGWCYMIDYWYGLSSKPEKSREKAVELVDKAMALNDLIDLPHTLYGKILYSYRRYEEAKSEGERAIALNPNGADACAHYACILTFSGMPDKSPFWLGKAFRLNPMPPVFYYSYLGMTNNVLGQYEEALDAYIKGFKLNPNYLYNRIGIAETYSLLGDNQRAKIASAEVLKLHPGFSVKYHIRAMQYKNQADEDRFINALCKSGLPE
jgi:adenylate cyclase